MTGLVRKTILLSAVGLMVAGAAAAGVPSAANSTVPTHINTTGYTNPPDPTGAITYTIRDAQNAVVANAEVVLDFTQCTDVRLHQTVSGASTVTTCVSKRVTGNTDAFGVITINVVGSTFAPGTQPPRAVRDCVAVTVNSVPFPNMSAGVYNLDGVDGSVGAGDLGRVISDFTSGNTSNWRADLDDSGVVGAGDLGIVIAVFNTGTSASTVGPYCP